MHFPYTSVNNSATSISTIQWPERNQPRSSDLNENLKQAVQLEQQGKIDEAQQIYFHLFWEDSTNNAHLNFEEFQPENTNQYAGQYGTMCEKYGLATANFLLGQMLLFGKGVGKNDNDAAACFKQAADHGFEFASTSLKTLYLAGRGIQKNSSHALDVLEQAVAEGCPDATYQLGVLYSKGELVTANPARAFELFKLVADKHAGAAYALATIFDNKPQPEKWTLDYFFSDYLIDAIKYYRLADKSGHPTAAKKLIQKGEQAEKIGRYQEFASLIKYYAIAVQKKLVPQKNIAPLSKTLFERSKDYKKHAIQERCTTSKILYLSISKQCQQAAADLGHPDAAHLCAVDCKEKGDLPAAVTYYGIAGKKYAEDLEIANVIQLRLDADTGNTEAEYDYAMYLLKFKPANESGAIDYFERAAKKDHDAALYELGKIYEAKMATFSVLADYKSKAISYFARASNLHHPEALTAYNALVNPSTKINI